MTTGEDGVVGRESAVVVLVEETDIGACFVGEGEGLFVLFLLCFSYCASLEENK